MNISSISLTNLFVSSHVVPIFVDVNVDVVVAVASNVVTIGPMGANAIVNVEGTSVLFIGMIVKGELSRVAYLS